MPQRCTQGTVLSSDRLRSDAHRCAGFTVAELLIVVAIVGVLVAIAIPVFTSQLERAQEATCEANRRSLKGMVTSSYLLDRTRDQQQLFNESLATLQGQGGAKLCPLGGTYSLEGDLSTGTAVIKCTKHGATIEDELYGFIGTQTQWNDDQAVRLIYANKTGRDTWPEVTGTGGESMYLQFKSYSHSPSDVYLYANTVGKIDTTQNRWIANYICDTKGLIGDKGQWYQVTTPEKGAGIAALGEDVVTGILRDNASNKVNLVGGKFEPAS